MTNQGQSQIIAGPSREDLFDALRLRHESRTVTVTVESSSETVKRSYGSLDITRILTLDVLVDSIGIEDGSGNSWLFKLSEKDGKLGSRRLEGHFNTTRRRGWIRPILS